MKRKKKNDLKATLLSGFGRIAGDIIDGLSSQEVMCGTYADGTPRSFIDALRGDYISPEKKKKILKKKAKKKKDKKKKDKFEKTFKKIQKEKKKLMKANKHLFG
jgi:hypothetical protein|nr:MAG TPA: hypothetical protein [Caudoviricetes sp.]